jgi:hypothetical protein
MAKPIEALAALQDNITYTVILSFYNTKDRVFQNVQESQLENWSENRIWDNWSQLFSIQIFQN